MSDRTSTPPSEPVPFFQRMYDSPFVLLAAGLIIMFVFFTGWGLWELLTLPPAKLP